MMSWHLTESNVCLTLNKKEGGRIFVRLSDIRYVNEDSSGRVFVVLNDTVIEVNHTFEQMRKACIPENNKSDSID